METYTVTVDDYKTISWYQNGKCHRLDGPAVEHANGSKHWYLNGERHRIDGPAIEFAHGAKSWFLNGKQLSEAEFNKQTKAANCVGKIVTIDGKKYTLTEIT